MIFPCLEFAWGTRQSGESFGATLVQLPEVLHGVQREIFLTKPDDRLFKGMQESLLTGHYHSWVLTGDNWPSEN